MSASDCHKCYGTGYDDGLNQICTCGYGRRYRAQNMHATHFSDDALVAAAEREGMERCKAAGFVPCKGTTCRDWVDPQENQYCENCQQEWWYNDNDVS